MVGGVVQKKAKHFMVTVNQLKKFCLTRNY